MNSSKVALPAMRSQCWVNKPCARQLAGILLAGACARYEAALKEVEPPEAPHEICEVDHAEAPHEISQV